MMNKGKVLDSALNPTRRGFLKGSAAAAAAGLAASRSIDERPAPIRRAVPDGRAAMGTGQARPKPSAGHD